VDVPNFEQANGRARAEGLRRISRKPAPPRIDHTKGVSRQGFLVRHPRRRRLSSACGYRRVLPVVGFFLARQAVARAIGEREEEGRQRGLSRADAWLIRRRFQLARAARALYARRVIELTIVWKPESGELLRR
jgi:hypothetical protein